MKKLVTNVFVVCVLLAMLCTFTACGGNNDNASTDGTTPAATESASDNAASDEETTPADDTASDETTGDSADVASGKYATIQEFIDSDLIQSQLEGLQSSLEESGMTINIVGEDNKLIYDFTLSEGMEEVAGLADGLKSSMDAQASTFQQVASSLKLAVEVDNPVVVVRYLSSNGDEIYSQEFAAE